MTNKFEILKNPWAVALLSFALGLVLCAGFFASVIYSAQRSDVTVLPSSADGTGLQFASTAAYLSDRHGNAVRPDVVAQRLATRVSGLTIQADAFFASMSPGARGMTVNAMRVFDHSPLVAVGDITQARVAREHILQQAKTELGGDALALGVGHAQSLSADKHEGVAPQSGVAP